MLTGELSKKHYMHLKSDLLIPSLVFMRLLNQNIWMYNTMIINMIQNNTTISYSHLTDHQCLELIFLLGRIK